MMTAAVLPSPDAAERKSDRDWERKQRVALDAAIRDIGPAELRSPLMRRIHSDKFVTEESIARLVGRLERYNLDAESKLVDIGCSTAGASLYISERLSATLYGLDIDSTALARARQRVRNFDLANQPLFDCASFEASWLEPEVADAVISIDALHMAPRPHAALSEIHRILAPRGTLLFNVYVGEDDPNASVWVRHIEAAGFAMLDIDDQTEHWRWVMNTKHRACIEAAPFLERRFGTLVAPTLAISRTMLGLDYGPCVIDSTRRVELVARKPLVAPTQTACPTALGSAPNPLPAAPHQRLLPRSRHARVRAKRESHAD